MTYPFKSEWSRDKMGTVYSQKKNDNNFVELLVEGQTGKRVFFVQALWVQKFNILIEKEFGYFEYPDAHECAATQNGRVISVTIAQKYTFNIRLDALIWEFVHGYKNKLAFCIYHFFFSKFWK